jgi:hypothetical protein
MLDRSQTVNLFAENLPDTAGQEDDLHGEPESATKARKRSVSMSLGLAQSMLADRVEGLLDGPAAARPPV